MTCISTRVVRLSAGRDISRPVRIDTGLATDGCVRKRPRAMVEPGQRMSGSLASLPNVGGVVDDDRSLLSDEQVASFYEKGFLSIPAVTTREEVTRLVPVYDALFDRRAGFDEGNYFDFAGDDDRDPALPQILQPSKYEPLLRESVAFRNCAAMAKRLLGPTAEFVFDHAMVKPAGGKPTPWHQDQAFWRAGMPYRVISFWVPLQDVSAESGCLKFIEQSNHGPLYEHRPLDDDPSKHGLEAIGVRDDAAVSCPLAAGGATVHHWLTLHGADANRTSLPRRAYAIGFGVRGEHSLVTREYPWNRRRNTESAQRHRASLAPWPRLKEEVKARLTRMRLL